MKVDIPVLRREAVMASCPTAEKAVPRSIHNPFMVSDWLIACAARTVSPGGDILRQPRNSERICWLFWLAMLSD